MVVLMACAALYAVLQLAVLGSLTRSTRIGTAMLAVATGCYACGAVALAAELGYTRLTSLITGQSLYDVVQTASFTVDPFIEEIVKILPLLLIGVIGIRRRVQWGLTDFLIIGAGIGSGFALAEALLRFSWRAHSAISDGHGGVVLTISLSAPTIRGPFELLGGWLPAPVGSWDLFGPSTGDLNLHLLWTAVAGVGIGVVTRMRGWRRFLGLIPLLYASVDHAANNLAISTSAGGLGGFVLDGMDAVRLRLPLLIFLLLIAATVVDLRLTLPIRRKHPELLTAAERDSRYASLALGRYALVRPPWTALVAIRFALLRRATWYALADRPDRPPPELMAMVGDLAARIDRSKDPGRWRQAVAGLGLHRRPLAAVIKNPQVIVWLALGVLPAIYFVIGGAPLTGGLQVLMQAVPITILAAGLLAVGIGYGCWQLAMLLRRLPDRIRGPWAEGLLRSLLRILVGATTCGLAVGAIIVVLAGGRGGNPAISNYHLLDALGSALLIAALLLLLVGLFTMFPPGGLLLAGAGGGAAAAGGSAAASLSWAGVLGLAGAALMGASGYSGWNEDDWDDWEEQNYGDRSRGGRQGGKGGRRTGGPGSGEGGRPGSNIAQNEQFDDAVAEGERQIGRKLSKDEITAVHREISGGDEGYHDIVQVILDMYG